MFSTKAFNGNLSRKWHGSVDASDNYHFPINCPNLSIIKDGYITWIHEEYVSLISDK